MKYEKLRCKQCNKFMKMRYEDKKGYCKYLLQTDKKDKELNENNICIFMLVDKWEKI